MSSSGSGKKDVIEKPEVASSGKLAVPHKRHSKFYFDNTLIVILIEDTLFNVHRYQLMKSETFSDMFKIASESEQESGEGSSPENPIVMSGVKASDFEALLTVLYATRFSTYHPDPDASLIIPAFRLANMWNFADLRTYLLPLAEKVLGDIDKIVFAREFDVKDWLAPAHTRICQRTEALTSEEAKKLGIESLLLILRIREVRSGQGVTPPDCPNICGYTLQTYCNNCGKRPFSALTGTLADAVVGGKVKTWIDSGCIFAT
ncbi:hypothetical protein BDV93DRAFT_561213 [Ceratobasidium sp. AG-I]|nr:hypothetical protein BDV93DRAFT_561213 [Ceratobasidium sp. AG-I]